MIWGALSQRWRGGGGGDGRECWLVSKELEALGKVGKSADVLASDHT